MRRKINKLIIAIFLIGMMFAPAIQNVSAMEIEPLNELLEIERFDDEAIHYDIEINIEARPGDCKVEFWYAESTGGISGIYPIDGITSNNGIYQATAGGEWLSYPNTADVTVRISRFSVPGEYTIDFDEETGLIHITFTPEAAYCQSNVIVEVPDTLSNIPVVIYGLGALLILGGGTLITSNMKKIN